MSKLPAMQTTSAVLRRAAVQVDIDLRPFGLTVRRRGRRVLGPVTARLYDGTVEDQFVQLTEGVVAHEEREDPVVLGHARIAALREHGADIELDGATLSVALDVDDVVSLVLRPAGTPLRTELRWPGHPEGHYAGLGARHGTHADQAGRQVQLGADRRYTGPDCPPDMLDIGGIPQGDYAPVPFVLSSRGWGAWLDTGGNGTRFELGDDVAISVRARSGPLRLHLLCHRTPAARLRAYLEANDALPVLLPEWGYGHWKSRDVYEDQRAVEDDFDGYREHALPLDAIVIDSPWETQYNTWEFNPHQFPDPVGLVGRMRADGVRTVVWVAPWINLDSTDGQIPPQEESKALHQAPAPTYAEAAEAGHFISDATGEPFVAKWWMGKGSPIDFTSPEAELWWRRQAEGVLRLGVQGIKADDGEGFYLPDDLRFADGTTGAASAWAHGLGYRRSMQAALDAVHPGEGVLFGRPGWTGQQAIGVTWGGDQPSDWWSLRTLVGATLSAAASGFSNWSHDVGGYLGKLLVERCPQELFVRWTQFGCFTPLMHAHGRFEQEAWTYDEETLEIFRAAALLHERLVPYVRAAAAGAARHGLPIVRPLALTDPRDPRGWVIADAYGYGPALWVAPVLEEGARERDVELPAGRWIDLWTGERVTGGDEVTAPSPLHRIPVWVRDGSIVVTYPEEHVAGGLGDTPERERPLEATLWGEPRLGRTAVRLADGTVIRWTRGAWSVTPVRPVAFASR
jgi:alpha-glucosidase (family GH31 glycosyl hydrolase)